LLQESRKGNSELLETGSYKTVIQEFPIRIKTINQSLLFFPPPIFEFLFPVNSVIDILKLFIIYQITAIVFFCEPGKRARHMFVQPAGKVVCNSNIQNSLMEIRQNIYVKLGSFHFKIFYKFSSFDLSFADSLTDLLQQVLLAGTGSGGLAPPDLRKS